MFSYSLGKYPVVEILDHMVFLYLIFWVTSMLFLTLATPACIPTNSTQRFLFLHNLIKTCFSTTSSTLVSSVFDFSNSDKCEVTSCSFNLHFPDKEWCWASCHMSVGHVNVFFGEMSVHVFCPFFNGIICWLICFLIYSWQSYLLEIYNIGSFSLKDRNHLICLPDFSTDNWVLTIVHAIF